MIGALISIPFSLAPGFLIITRLQATIVGLAESSSSLCFVGKVSSLYLCSTALSVLKSTVPFRSDHLQTDPVTMWSFTTWQLEPIKQNLQLGPLHPAFRAGSHCCGMRLHVICTANCMRCSCDAISAIQIVWLKSLCIRTKLAQDPFFGPHQNWIAWV